MRESREHRDHELDVLHIVTSQAFAGLERHVLTLSRELREIGCRAEIACAPAARALREAAAGFEVPVHPVQANSRGGWRGALARRILTNPPGIVHVHDGRAATLGVPLGCLARALVVRTQHFTRPASTERRPGLAAMSLALHRTVNRGVDGYIAVSRAVADAARDRHETNSAEVTVIPPGIELPPAANGVADIARRMPDADPLVAYIGRLEREKHLEVLLQAIPSVLERVPGCRFVIAGSGNAEPELRALAASLGIESAVEWKGWIEGPGAVLERADVYVNTWPWEGFGMAMAEAMAAGLPVIATTSGASPEVVEDGVTGLTVPPDDPPALAAALTRLVQDAPLAASMGAAGRARAIERYGIHRTAEETLAFYRRLQAGRHR